MTNSNWCTITLEWKDGFAQTFDRPLARSGYFKLDNHENYCSSLNAVEFYTIRDKKTNEVLRTNKPVNKKKEAVELYAKYQNYARVARELGVHPTTIRTWLKDD